MKKENIILDYFLITYLLLIIAFASSLSQNIYFVNSSLLVLVLISIFRKTLKLSTLIIFITAFWFLINIVASIFLGTTFVFNLVAGYPIKLLITYLVLINVNINFWVKFEKVFYFFVIVASVIYVFNLLLPAYFFSLRPLFEPLTADVYATNHPFYWNALIYTHHTIEQIPTSDFPRNSGFMWEPGAYAMMLVLAILLNIIDTKIYDAKRILLYTIVLVTTMSTLGYISLIVIAILLLVTSKNKIKYFLPFFVLFLILYFELYKLDFLFPKINSYLLESENNFSGLNYSGIHEVNRYLAFFLKFRQWLDYPLGYGVVSEEVLSGGTIKTDGVNGLGDILRTWGVIGFGFMIYALWKFMKQRNNNVRSNFFLIISIIPILMGFFSNPIELNPVLYLIVLTPFINTFEKTDLRLVPKTNRILSFERQQ